MVLIEPGSVEEVVLGKRRGRSVNPFDSQKSKSRGGSRSGGGSNKMLQQLQGLQQEMLEAQGVREVGSPNEVSAGTVVIRAHGAPAGTAEEFKRRGVSVVDATCPKVVLVSMFDS